MVDVGGAVDVRHLMQQTRAVRKDLETLAGRLRDVEAALSQHDVGLSDGGRLAAVATPLLREVLQVLVDAGGVVRYNDVCEALGISARSLGQAYRRGTELIECSDYDEDVEDWWYSLRFPAEDVAEGLGSKDFH